MYGVSDETTCGQCSQRDTTQFALLDPRVHGDPVSLSPAPTGARDFHPRVPRALRPRAVL